MERETYMIHVAVFILVGHLDSDMHAIDESDHTRKSSSIVKGSF